MRFFWLDLLVSILVGAGVMCGVAPAVLFVWIRGSCERYIWVIQGPFPFSHMGSGPFWLWFGAGMLAAGGVLVVVGYVLKRMACSSPRRGG